MKTWSTAVVGITLLLVASLGAQSKTMGATVTETFTIEAIDHSARVVTLKDKNGALSDVVCGPEVQRFDALKVGDKVTMRYYESLVSAIKATNAPPKPPMQAAVTRTPGNKPGGTISQQFTATVTIVAIDPKVPSVTIKGSDGRTLSFKVEDKKNLEGFKAGDTVEITYTQALAISVTPAK
ncbi:MAG TPA: hypothetical protein VLT86_04375 [Vicinamibacterales bacterium]|nr:hypothetical protein [Vicinamibacterales bacterium]